MDWTQNRLAIQIAPTGAEIGSKVVFERKKKLVEGLVIGISTNSVIVEISMKDQVFLSLDNDRTVVNHKNYQLVS